MNQKEAMELTEMQEILNELMERTNKFSKPTVLAGFMMLMEEWCKANHENMVETFDQLNEICKAVNAALGAYGSEEPEELFA